ncbi:large ribosomal subunit protein mL54 [Lethenteron reissneri]|uniref:large ribosomal subunit protein mL54 n=1 Tax=Lethenteron reissneri TaxID=7753 RepID=UPI002AB7E9A3|nr:large ribosomal subunit protein mL54 [Lethenteron reissneri]
MAACGVGRLLLLLPATLARGAGGAGGAAGGLRPSGGLLRGFAGLVGPGLQTLMPPAPPASRGYAKKPAFKAKGKAMVKEVLVDPELSRDPEVLVSHCVGLNYLREGSDPPLRADSEYPPWLFELNVGPPLKLDEVEPDSMEYFRLLRKQHMWRVNKLSRHKRIR